MKNGTARARGWGAILLTTTELTGLAATVIAVALPGDAHAAGFALKEQSTTAQGNAFAGATAGAEDVTYMFFNPAALTRLEGNQAAAVISYILPSAKITNATASVAAPFGTAITGSSEDGAVSAVIPALYGAYSLSPDLKLGLSVTVPFGLSTDYEDGWIGRYHALATELRLVNINPVVAYRVNDKVSIGGGIQVEHAEATLSSAIDFGTLDNVLGIFAGAPTADDGSSELTGDDWAFGFNLGVLFELSEATRFGVAYRSEIAHTLEGEVDLIPAAPLAMVSRPPAF